MNEAYTGRQISLNIAASEAQAIVVGEVLNAGKAEMGGPGQAYYDGAKIRVFEALSGKVKPELKIAYTCQKLPEQSAEAEPREGELYLFFLALRNDGTWRATKIDVASPANRELVRKVIEASTPARETKR